MYLYNIIIIKLIIFSIIKRNNENICICNGTCNYLKIKVIIYKRWF